MPVAFSVDKPPELGFGAAYKVVVAVDEDGTFCAVLAVAAGKGMTGDPQQKAPILHPYHEAAGLLRTDRHEMVTTPSGSQIPKRKSGVAPIESNRFVRDPTVQSWGLGADRQAWVQDPAELAGRTQNRLEGAWAPGADWHGHPTYITACPDFTGILTSAFDAYRAAGSDERKAAAAILDAVKQIGASLQGAPMNHGIIQDPAHQQRLEVANKAIIARCFAAVDMGTITTKLPELGTPQDPPSPKGSDKPVEGDAPNDEGMVLLQDWSSRGG